MKQRSSRSTMLVEPVWNSLTDVCASVSSHFAICLSSLCLSGQSQQDKGLEQPSRAVEMISFLTFPNQISLLSTLLTLRSFHIHPCQSHVTIWDCLPLRSSFPWNYGRSFGTQQQHQQMLRGELVQVRNQKLYRKTFMHWFLSPSRDPCSLENWFGLDVSKGFFLKKKHHALPCSSSSLAPPNLDRSEL